MFIYLFDDAGVLSGPVDLFVTPGMGIQIPSNGIQLSFELPPPKNIIRGSWWAAFREKWSTGVVRCIARTTALIWHGPSSASCRIPIQLNLGLVIIMSGKRTVGYLTRLYSRQISGARPWLSAINCCVRPFKNCSLQYAEDIGNASDQEQLALMEWKLYSVELNRIQHQVGFPTDINWPVMPEPAA